jgi:uncharacterized protein YukE
MSSFSVTPAELEGAAGGLAGLVGQLEQVGDISSIHTGCAENAQLDAAIGGFVRPWVSALTQVAQTLSVVTGNVATGAGSYKSADSTMSGAIGR